MVRTGQHFNNLRGLSAVVVTSCDLVGLGIVSVLQEARMTTALVASVDEIDAKPDVVFLDEGRGLLIPLRAKWPQSKIVLLAARCDPVRIRQVVRRDVSGYLCLSDRLIGRLRQVVQDVWEGGVYLSPAAAAALALADHFETEIQPRLNDYHTDVLRLMGQHQCAGQIAARLGRSVDAIYQVQRYLRNLFDVQTNGALLERVTWLGFGHRHNGG